MRVETKIVKGVNCWRARSAYYGMAISSSLGCLTITLLELWPLPHWEDMRMVLGLLSLAGLLYCPILILRSVCLPIPTITNKTRRMEGEWSYITVYLMLFMFFQSHRPHPVSFGIFALGAFTNSIAVRQLNWPARDLYIQHVVFTLILACLSGYLGSLQQAVGPAFYVFMCMLALSFLVNHIFDKVLLPSTDFVHSPCFRDLDV